MDSRILDCITSPADLKLLSDGDLELLAHEIRAEIIAVTSKTGGHVASSLGAVEVILALHSLLDCPKDKIVFDVGHQAYAHKLITGRLPEFNTLRQYGGVSGFPKPDESPYDVHPSGHASDSLSVALGLAMARDLRGSKERIVSVIGDASLSGGMAFEACNTIGQLQTPVVIILNDNEMSIGKSVGALTKNFGALRSSRWYRSMRDTAQEKLEQRLVGNAFVTFGRNAKDSMKQFVVPETMMFEQLGILCTPPVDGHNIAELRDIIATALESDGPVLVHVVTQKGAGYKPAIDNPELFHGLGPYDIASGKPLPKNATTPSYTSVFSSALRAEARKDSRIVAITAAMGSGTGLTQFKEEFPERCFDIGIAEENAVGVASGLAIGGLKPVVAIYSTFLQRAFDQMTVDVALPDFDVVYAVDRAGIVGADGPTHHGVFDMAYMRTIPNMRLLAPSNEAELVSALHTALKLTGPVAIRYPRGNGLGVEIPSEPSVFEVGESHTLREGKDVAILAFGDRVEPSLVAAEILADKGIDCRVVDMRWVKPVDEKAVRRACDTKLVVTVENGALMGGAGDAVLESISKSGLSIPTLCLGIPDAFIPQGNADKLLSKLGLDAEGIADSIQSRMAK